ncbi:hypothetical protein ES703_119903 [subsurface metagenome]
MVTVTKTDPLPDEPSLPMYIPDFDGDGDVDLVDFGEQGYFLNFPSKFISNDGYTLWLCYSANFARNWRGVEIKSNPPSSRYGLVLQEVKLLDPLAYRRLKIKPKDKN